MEGTKTQQAIIYRRVACVSQSDDGSSHADDDRACEFADERGYVVRKSFSDMGVSGNSIDRPGLNAMLAYMKSRDDEGPFLVMIENADELARDIGAFRKIRRSISEAGGTLFRISDPV